MGDIKITVVEDYDHESIAVFVDGDFIYGNDPYHIDLFEFLRSLTRRKGFLDGVVLEQEYTYGRPHEFFDEQE